MAEQNRNQQPGFFWQAAGILLPVIALSAVGLIALRQDERAAEQDARSRAVESAQSLARAVAASASEGMRRFIGLQSAATSWPPNAPNGSAAASGNATPTAEYQKWARDFPELSLSNCVSPPAEVQSDGQVIQPAPIPLAPTPPPWFCDLSSGQRKLWESLHDAIARQSPPEKVEVAARAFLDTRPSPDAGRAAAYLMESPENILSQRSALASETGISFQDIACCRLLLAATAPLPGSTLEEVLRQEFEHPSFETAAILQLTEERTNGCNPALCEKVRRFEQLQLGQTRAREWVGSMRWPETNTTPAARAIQWVRSPAGDALAFVEPAKSISDPSVPGGLDKGRYRVSFVSEKVVEAIFARSLLDNRFLIPRYARADVTIAGRRMVEPNGALSTPKPSLLGSASSEIMPSGELGAANFDIALYLTSRAEMLSTELRRARLFVGLIVGAFVAALAGVLAAHRAWQRQLRLNEMKSNFVASVSHELRAPLASVRLMAESLELGKIGDPQKQKEYFRFIGQEGRRLSALIENVLDFSRIEQGRKQYDLEPSDLVALTRETINLMTPLADEKGVRLVSRRTLEIKQGEVNMDGRAIQQALVNLIDNAIKHSPEGAAVTINLLTGSGGTLPKTGGKLENFPAGAASSVFISVEDNGEGIPPEDHGKIFERFYRRGSELRRKTPGVGIGLSIVKHIVEAHGGRVHVQSAVGRGSQFVIELPFQH